MMNRVTNARAGTMPTFDPLPKGLLQRKCACGQHTIAGAKCAECHKKRMNLQRRATNQVEPTTVPPIVHDVLRSPGQPLDSTTRTFMEPNFGHDFSQVQVHTAAPKKIQTKLTVNQPGDKYEQEADRVTEQVMRMPDPQAIEKARVSRQAPGTRIQRSCPAFEENLYRQPMEDEEELIKTKPLSYQIVPIVKRQVEKTGLSAPVYMEREGFLTGSKKFAIAEPSLRTPTEARVQLGSVPTHRTGTIHLNISYGLHSTVCTPVGTDVKGIQDFVMKTVGAKLPPGRFAGGFTSPKVSYWPTELEVTTTKTKKGVTCRPKVVTPTLTTEARYISSGTHEVPGLVGEVAASACGKKGKDLELPLYAKVSKKIAGLAKQAEEEHCDDFGYAFNQTVGKWGSEVNKLAKAGKTYGPKATVDQCKKLIQMNLTKTLEKRLKDFSGLAPKTDTRDHKGYHSFELDLSTISIDGKCTKLVADVVKSSTNKIGSIPSKDVMK